MMLMMMPQNLDFFMRGRYYVVLKRECQEEGENEEKDYNNDSKKKLN